jgi:erythronate-4-phosphate dehydrogenase
MKLVIDHKIPFIRGTFEPHAEVLYLPGAEIRKEHLKDADGLLIRTRTRCNEALLGGTPVRFIGTATIGFDHIDTDWCRRQGIQWASAPGCNSGSVAQYITAALLEVAERQGFRLSDKTLGIIGVGHVGSKVERVARILGMKVILNDPPRERTEGKSGFTDLDRLLEKSDIVSLHVPLNRGETDRTLNLVDRHFLERLKPGAILINSSRGEVIHEADLIAWLHEKPAIPKREKRQPHLSLVLDVWRNEPDISLDLIGLTAIATPHIAGYSADGKYLGTRMTVDAAAAFFGIKPGPLSGAPQEQRLHVTRQDGLMPTSRDYVRAAYDILADDRNLRDSPENFENLRNNYPFRREFPGCRVDPYPAGETGRILRELGFKSLNDKTNENEK